MGGTCARYLRTKWPSGSKRTALRDNSCPEMGGHPCRHECQSLKHNVLAWNGAPALSWIISYMDCAVPGALVLMKSMILPLSFKNISLIAK